MFQQALLAAFEKVGSLEDRSRFRPWLFRIIQRTFLVERRRQVLRRVLPLPETEPDRDDLYDAYEHLAWKQSMLAALAGLGARPRATLLLHDVAGFTLAEVAAMLGDRSLSATKMRLTRARERMRLLLAGDGEVPHDRPAPRGTEPTDVTAETLRTIHTYRTGDGDA